MRTTAMFSVGSSRLLKAVDFFRSVPA